MSKKVEPTLNLDVGVFKKNFYTKSLSNWKIGGICDIYIEPNNIKQLRNALDYLLKNKIPIIVIGNGTNILFDDKGFRGAILKLGNGFSYINCLNKYIICGASTYVPFLAKKTADLGLSGLEHIVGIPGYMGGLIAMNGGSQRKSISESIDYVKSIRIETGNEMIFNNNECNFSYRNSIFQNSQYIITEVGLKLEKKETNIIRDEMLKILHTRNIKFPRKLPNCGSVFKNDDVNFKNYGSPGSIVESLGLKGTKIGNAEISQKHANFIINLGNASSNDVLELIYKVQHAFKLKTRLQLQTEILYLNKDGKFIHPSIHNET